MAEGTIRPELHPPPNGTAFLSGTCSAVPESEPGDGEGRARVSSARCPGEDKGGQNPPACQPTEPANGEEPDAHPPEPRGGSRARAGLCYRVEGARVPEGEQRAPRRCIESAEGHERGTDSQAGTELGSLDRESPCRVDSEDSISSTLMDMESTASSGRSTPAMLSSHDGGVTAAASTVSGGKSLNYTCFWDECQLVFSSSPDLAEHIRASHVDRQREGVFVCLWKGCKVYNTPSTSQSWLQRHMLSHSGDKPFKCVVGGCSATFASQGGLARHVPTHFSSQGSSKASSQGRVKEESPSKAGHKRRKLRNKYRRSLPRPHDFFDAQTMDAIRHRAICLNLATHIESLGNGNSVVFHSKVIARRKEASGKVKFLLHWTPEDILPDVWVNENDQLQMKTKVVHLSKLPADTAVLLDPTLYRMFL
ncbi:Zinc finger protein AEBP2 [Oryzias melastigma]|uniref:AE binding protein 2 n=1 Tax=Oryzias melastigma TaxID=30732 RepID=A0A3B3CRU8_ORYME|nr:zinc finger protein aebp2 [Oryzias melastigma]KAF6719172.1 Zinc finger protein AEBP2 [Oryzias melastigma]KAF6733326.1 Zinc finger protein AEBP2 [Oryzias melastigma]